MEGKGEKKKQTVIEGIFRFMFISSDYSQISLEVGDDNNFNVKIWGQITFSCINKIFGWCFWKSAYILGFFSLSLSAENKI